MPENLPVIVLGSGGHARVIVPILRMLGITVLGCTVADPAKELVGPEGIQVLGADDAIGQWSPHQVRLVNGLGVTPGAQGRSKLFAELRGKGYRFMSVIHPHAVVTGNVTIGEGVQLMASATIQPGVLIGDNSIVNTAALIDHDSVIGEHTHIAPGAVVCGGVRIGEHSYIGAGAVIIQGVEIGEHALVAAGATVVKDVPAKTRVQGVPAKPYPRD